MDDASEREEAPASTTSSLVDNIFREFMEKKEEALQKSSHKSKKHKKHHKKHKKHKDRKRSPEDDRRQSLEPEEPRSQNEVERCPEDPLSLEERIHARESLQDVLQSPENVKESCRSPPGGEQIVVDDNPESYRSPPEAHRDQTDDPQEEEKPRSSEKKKKHKKHKHKERSKDKHRERHRDGSESTQGSKHEEKSSKDKHRQQNDSCSGHDVECKEKRKDRHREGIESGYDLECAEESKEKYREGHQENNEQFPDIDHRQKGMERHSDRHQDDGQEHGHGTIREIDTRDRRNSEQSRYAEVSAHYKNGPKHEKPREVGPSEQQVCVDHPDSDRDESGTSRHRHKKKHRGHDSSDRAIELQQTKLHKRSSGSSRHHVASPDNRMIDLVHEDLVVTLDNSPEHPGSDDVIYEGMETSQTSELRKHRKRRPEDREKSRSSARHPEMTDPQHKVLQHLCEEEEDDDGDVRAVPDLQNFRQEQAEGPRLGAYSMFGTSSGSQWMQLPKDMEDSEDVNASSWMRLPKELETDDLPDFDSDKELCNFSDIPSRKKVKLSRELKLDVKLDISKALTVKPPPSEKTSDLIASIKNEIIGDLWKDIGDEKAITAPDTDPVRPRSPQPVPPPADLVEEELNTTVAPHTADQVVRKGLAPLKPCKLGIKISETSAALIASGRKAEEADPEAESQDNNLEEGEVYDEDSPMALCKTQCDQDEETSGSESSEIHISELSSSGSLSDTGSEAEAEASDGKSKKKKSSKHKKKKKKKDSRKRSSHGSRSRSPKKRRRSRSHSSTREYFHSREFDESKGVWKKVERWSTTHRSRSRDRYNKSRGRHARSRDRSRDRDYKRSRHNQKSDSRERQRDHRRGSRRSRSKSAGDDAVSDLRVKIDKAKLRQIALKNAYARLRAGGLKLKPDMLLQMKSGGKSVEELTDFCKQIADKDAEKQLNRRSSDESSEPEPASDEDAPFINHPFKVRDPASIVMNIRNARQLPILSALEKQSKGSELRLQFPVSSGSHHRDKEKEWVPVEKDTSKTVATLGSIPLKVKHPGIAIEEKAIAPALTAAAPSATPGGMLAIEAPPPVATPTPSTSTAEPVAKVAEEDKVFKEVMPVNIGSVVSERLSAMRKLQSNPHDVQALGTMYKSQTQMNQWAESKNLPGHFTGTTGVNLLTSSELSGINQVWAKKDQLKNAMPISGGIGKLMLERMGWKEGTGLGKEGSGNLEPLMLDVKIDRKGLTSMEENFRKTTSNIPNKVTKDLSGKHPVSALMELCNRKKWGAPQFELVHESGPAHKKNFLFKVLINNLEYQSTIASTNKKEAKAQAATVCLQELGLVPR